MTEAEWVSSSLAGSATAALQPRRVARSGGIRVRLADTTLMPDAGGVFEAEGPSVAALERQIFELVARQSPVVRFAGGALIADLSLHDNLMLESALHPVAPPSHLLPGLERLFAAAGCALQRRAWQTTYPHQASEQERMQVRMSRALMANPDVLIVDGDAWDDALLDRRCFSRAFAAQHPWRALVWARTRTGPPEPPPAPDHTATT